MTKALPAFVTALALAVLPACAEDRPPVDVALILLADASQSMDLPELVLQRQGYAAAIRSPSTWQAIRAGAHQRIAIAVVEFGEPASQRVVVPWTIVDDPSDLEGIAVAIEAPGREALGTTGLGAAMSFAGHMMAAVPAIPDRRVIDVSGDGPGNGGMRAAQARDWLVAEGITINGLPVMSDPDNWFPEGATLIDYYEACVIGGEGAFVVPTKGGTDFANALKLKLVLEIAGVDATRPVRAAGFSFDICRE